MIERIYPLDSECLHVYGTYEDNQIVVGNTEYQQHKHTDLFRPFNFCPICGTNLIELEEDSK
jgi:hypothetical protein